MTTDSITYVAYVKGLQVRYETERLDDAFDFIRRCMPCEATINTVKV